MGASFLFVSIFKAFCALCVGVGSQEVIGLAFSAEQGKVSEAQDIFCVMPGEVDDHGGVGFSDSVFWFGQPFRDFC